MLQCVLDSPIGWCYSITKVLGGMTDGFFGRDKILQGRDCFLLQWRTARDSPMLWVYRHKRIESYIGFEHVFCLLACVERLLYLDIGLE